MQIKNSFKSTFILISLIGMSLCALTRFSNQGPYRPQPANLPVCTMVWTNWLNRDNPGATGDWEVLKGFVELNQVCPAPMAINCQPENPSLAKQRITQNTEEGCICRNALMDQGEQCHDYWVRFACCAECPSGQPALWTTWINDDNQYGSGDWQKVSSLYQKELIPCPNPIGIVCEQISLLKAADFQFIAAYSSSRPFLSLHTSNFLKFCSTAIFFCGINENPKVQIMGYSETLLFNSFEVYQIRGQLAFSDFLQCQFRLFNETFRSCLILSELNLLKIHKTKQLESLANLCFNKIIYKISHYKFRDYNKNLLNFIISEKAYGKLILLRICQQFIVQRLQRIGHL